MSSKNVRTAGNCSCAWRSTSYNSRMYASAWAEARMIAVPGLVELAAAVRHAGDLHHLAAGRSGPGLPGVDAIIAAEGRKGTRDRVQHRFAGTVKRREDLTAVISVFSFLFR